MTELHRVKFKYGHPAGVWIVTYLNHDGVCILKSENRTGATVSAYESALVRLPRFDPGQLVTINIDSYFWGSDVADFVKEGAGGVYVVEGTPDENNKYHLRNVATLREVNAHVSVLEKWTGPDYAALERRITGYYSGGPIADPAPTGRRTGKVPEIAMGYKGPYSHRPSERGRGSEIAFKGKIFDDMPWPHKAAAREAKQLNKAYRQGWLDRGEDPYTAFGRPRGETYQPKTDGLDPEVAAVAEKVFEEQVQPVDPEVTSKTSPMFQSLSFKAALREAQRAALKMRLAGGDITPSFYHNSLKGIARREQKD